jgi:hypothetical protein
VDSVLVARDLTIRNGQAPPRSQGGGIRVAGALTLASTLIEGNRAGSGGGLQARASSVSITDSTVRANISDSGAGLFLTGGSYLTVRDSALYDNKATGEGGAIALDGSDPSLIQALRDLCEQRV